MFSQGRRQMAALNARNQVQETSNNQRAVQPLTPALPLESQNPTAVQKTTASNSGDKESATSVEKENTKVQEINNNQRAVQPLTPALPLESQNPTAVQETTASNSGDKDSTPSVRKENTTDGETSDVSEYTPSEQGLLNSEFLTSHFEHIQDNETPSTENCQISGMGGMDPAATPHDRMNLLWNNFTPDDELSANPTCITTVRKQLFPASVASQNDNSDILPLETVDYQPLMPVAFGNSLGQENSFISSEPPIISVSHSEEPSLEDMFFEPDDTESTVNVSHEVILESEELPQQEPGENLTVPILQQEVEIIAPGNVQQDIISTTTKRTRAPNTNSSSPTRKRQRNPSITKAMLATRAYNSGKAHVTSKGKERAAREVRGGCTPKCRKNCKDRITFERRQKLFETYYGSNSKNAQWLMLGKLVKQETIKRRTIPDCSSPHRKFSYKYYLTDDANNYIPVCQPMFLGTFDISITVVQNALKKNSPDKRGKQTTNRPKRISPSLKENVKNHIKSFPTIPSHYCRENTRRQYLQENLSIAKMYRMYLTERGTNTADTATERQYRDIFNNCFNLSFYQPKKDQCAMCVQWKDLSEDQKQENSEFVLTYRQHVASKELARNLKQQSKDLSRSDQNKDGKLKVICFDLQKVFFCPKTEVGDFFYKSKLSCYDFTVFDCTLKKATCYVWDQTIAGRGAVEISSCVFKFIQQESKNGLEELHIYSDSCWNQNKNQFLFTMYQVACQKFNLKIIHRYLEKGHTQMECDSVHASIERKIKNTAIFTPAEWYGYIMTAKVNKPHYAVVQMKREHFVSFSDLSTTNFAWDKVQTSKIHEIIVDSKSPGIAFCKKKLTDPEKKVDVSVKRTGRPIVLANFKPPQAYPGPLTMKPKLVKDLKWMMKKNLIPERALEFYKSLTMPTVGPVIFPHGQDSFEDDVPEVVDHNSAALDSMLEADDEAE